MLKCEWMRTKRKERVNAGGSEVGNKRETKYPAQTGTNNPPPFVSYFAYCTLLIAHLLATVLYLSLSFRHFRYDREAVECMCVFVCVFVLEGMLVLLESLLVW